MLRSPHPWPGLWRLDSGTHHLMAALTDQPSLVSVQIHRTRLQLHGWMHLVHGRKIEADAVDHRTVKRGSTRQDFGTGITGILTDLDNAGPNVPKATRAALVGSIVQLASLGFAFKDLAGNDRLTADETRTKAAISAANFGASLCEVMAQLATAEPKYALARYVQEQWAFVAVRHSKFAGFARWGGFAAGMATAAYDLFNANNAFRDDKDQLELLYGFSGLLGGVIALGVFFSWPFMWPLMILSIAVNIAIGLRNSNAISDWLSKCFFSVSTSVKLKERETSQLDYVSLGEELEQYAKAMGA